MSFEEIKKKEPDNNENCNVQKKMFLKLISLDCHSEFKYLIELGMYCVLDYFCM